MSSVPGKMRLEACEINLTCEIDFCSSLQVLTLIRRPDGYHSCYALAGLSAMQHQQTFKPSSNLTDPLYYAFGWNVDESEKTTRNDAEEDFLVPLHPIFTIPYDAVHAFRIMAMGKESF